MLLVFFKMILNLFNGYIKLFWCTLGFHFISLKGTDREKCECFQTASLFFVVWKLGAERYPEFLPYGLNSTEPALVYKPFILPSDQAPKLPSKLMETIMPTNQREKKTLCL